MFLFANAANRELGITYEWDFGDGSPASLEQNPTHTYAKTGIYTWKLTCTVNGGIYETTGRITVLATLPSQISLSRNQLKFGALPDSASTSSQKVGIRNTGSGTMIWTATPQQDWITVSPGSGTGDGEISLGVNASGLGAGTYAGTVRVSDPNATNTPQTIGVTLIVYGGGTNPPIGVVDTPTDGTAGIEGSVPVTGWAVDDIEVVSVKIYRDPAGGEGAGPTGYVYIGDAVFVEGARPDVEQAYPNYPLNEKAGWGYMMLTNFLPNQGNGTFRIHAIATDKEGNTTLLGSKTITCDNAHAVLPFGAIDTPSQGGTASGSAFRNFAWVLASMGKCIPADGSTIWAYVDGAPIGHPKYGYYRVDIATLFPGFCNAGAAIGYIDIDTTKYTNGVHTIVWSATDSTGVNNGFGSRYFMILNGGVNPTPKAAARQKPISVESVAGFSRDDREPVFLRRGFAPEAIPEAAYPERDGVIRIEIAEVEKLAIFLREEAIDTADHWLRRKGGEPPEPENYAGYAVVGEELRPLPIGSTFEAENGAFLWQPGPGFLGVHTFWITDLGRQTRKTIEVKIVPREGVRR